MLDSNLVSFRKMTLEDLPQMKQWLNQPHVHDWYDKDKQNTLDEVIERYGRYIKGEKPTDAYFVLYEKKPVAYIQTYKVNDWPELGDYVGYDDHTASVDLFIGDLTFMGHGLGNLMLKKFLKEIVFANPKIHTCIIGPEVSNSRAIKAYAKAGFRYVKTLHIPKETEPNYFMEITRSEVK